MTVISILGMLYSFIALVIGAVKRPMFSRALTACSILYLLSLVSKVVLCPCTGSLPSGFRNVPL